MDTAQIVSTLQEKTPRFANDVAEAHIYVLPLLTVNEWSPEGLPIHKKTLTWQIEFRSVLRDDVKVELSFKYHGSFQGVSEAYATSLTASILSHIFNGDNLPVDVCGITYLLRK